MTLRPVYRGKGRRRASGGRNGWVKSSMRACGAKLRNGQNQNVASTLTAVTSPVGSGTTLPSMAVPSTVSDREPVRTMWIV